MRVDEAYFTNEEGQVAASESIKMFQEFLLQRVGRKRRYESAYSELSACWYGFRRKLLQTPYVAVKKNHVKGSNQYGHGQYHSEVVFGFESFI